MPATPRFAAHFLPLRRLSRGGSREKDAAMRHHARDAACGAYMQAHAQRARRRRGAEASASHAQRALMRLACELPIEAGVAQSFTLLRPLPPRVQASDFADYTQSFTPPPQARARTPSRDASCTEPCAESYAAHEAQRREPPFFICRRAEARALPQEMQFSTREISSRQSSLTPRGG